LFARTTSFALGRRPGARQTALLDRRIARGQILAADRAGVLAFARSRYLAAPIGAAE